jgi:ribosomal protein L11 methyltransferase
MISFLWTTLAFLALDGAKRPGGTRIKHLSLGSRHLDAVAMNAVVDSSGDGDTGAAVRLVSLQCPATIPASVLSDALIEAGVLYVSVRDGNKGTANEEPIFAEHPVGTDGEPRLEWAGPESWDELMDAKRLWSNATLEVGFSPGADVERPMLSVLADLGLGTDGRPPTFSYADLAPKDWVTEVQSNWPPVQLPGCLTIKFPWHTADDVAAATASDAHGRDDDGQIVPFPVLTLHPGMAFGTGEHATTQLCCLALRRLLASSSASAAAPTVLDYGSGSGILSFAALLFGAESAVGVEIDKEALVTSRINAAENGLGERFEALECEEEEERGGMYPIVVANILAGTLVELADLLASRIMPGGALLLSGIYERDQVERVRSAFEARGVGEWEVEYSGGWALMQGKREGSSAAR